ncbi:hypothetical protein HN840_01250 [archaeon]|jgi:hypothetical protein|nr:hypothetical protein [archaeon]MBT3731036.1 hypothetical protein [archaeon]MBT4669726.1 hypothetical protein [archaeon]MBT5029876.1 hypothetical protein [archaeon]MBT5288448.1 hypothetical protein [archaeon]
MAGHSEFTLDHLAKEASFVLLDNSVFSEDLNVTDDRYIEDSWQSFSRYIYDVRNVASLDLDRLNLQLSHVEKMWDLIKNFENVKSLDSVVNEYSDYIHHLFVGKYKFSKNKGRSKSDINKFRIYEDICLKHGKVLKSLESQQLLSTVLRPSVPLAQIRKYMEKEKLHQSRNRYFIKSYRKNGVSEVDLNLAAKTYNLALYPGKGVVVLSGDKDIINLIYNFGVDFQSGKINGGLQSYRLLQRVSVFSPAERGWRENLNCRFQANSDGKVYTHREGPWF